jgi:voltage-gated potassium channel
VLGSYRIRHAARQSGSWRKADLTVAGRKLYRQIIIVSALYVLLLGLGSVGYMVIEGWSWTDSVYMTVITISTVGFGEIRPLSPVGRVFTGALIILGVSTTAYAFSTLADLIVAGEFRSLFLEKTHAEADR